MKKIKFLLIGIIIFAAWIGKADFTKAEGYFEVNPQTVEFTGSDVKKVEVTVKKKEEGLRLKFFFQNTEDDLPINLSEVDTAFIRLEFTSGDDGKKWEEKLRVVASKPVDEGIKIVEEKEINVSFSSSGNVSVISQRLNKDVPPGLVPCGNYLDLTEGTRPQPDCNLCYLFLMLNKIMDFMVKMVGVVGVIFIVVGGLILMASGGNENLHKQGWSIIRNTLVGVVIVLTAWVLINTILAITGFARVNLGIYDIKNGNWFELTCNLIPSTDTDTEPPPEGEEKKEEEIPPVPEGVLPMECSPCGIAKNGWTPDECLNSIKAGAPFIENSYPEINGRALLGAIMWNESRAQLNAENPEGEDSGCGPVQLTPKAADSVDGGSHSCGDLKQAASVGWGAKYLAGYVIKQVYDKGFLNIYSKDDGSKFNVVELISAGYQGGTSEKSKSVPPKLGANIESKDCGPSGRCIKQNNRVPRWYCTKDFSNNQCVENQGYKNTRDVYTKNVLSKYNEYLGCLKNAKP